MGGHICIARADVCVPRSPRKHAVAPLAACVTCLDAHLLPGRLAASVIAL